MIHLLQSPRIVRLDPALPSHRIDRRRVSQQRKDMVAWIAASLPSGAVELVREEQLLLVHVRCRREKLVHVVGLPHQDVVGATEAVAVVLEKGCGSGDLGPVDKGVTPEQRGGSVGPNFLKNPFAIELYSGRGQNCTAWIYSAPTQGCWKRLLKDSQCASCGGFAVCSLRCFV